MNINSSTDIPDPFFAFPDGVLDYNCKECNKNCCENAGMILDVRRDMDLLRLYPVLQKCALGIRDPYLNIAASPCELLDNDGFCRIQKEHGAHLKPEVCLLEPFGQFYKCGGIRIVVPNYSCNFTITVPAQPGKVEGSHSLLRDIVNNSAPFRGRHPNRHPIYGLHPSESPADFLRHQKILLDACTAGLGKQPFFTTLNALSNESKSLPDFYKRALGILDTAEIFKSSCQDNVDTILHIIASSLTFSMPGLSFDGRIRALALGEVLLRQLYNLNHGREDLHYAFKFLIDSGTGIRLLARYTEMLYLPFIERDKVMLPSHITHAPLVLAAHVFVTKIQKGKSIIEALEYAMDTNIPSAVRLAFLTELGEWVEQIELTQKSPTRDTAEI
jgi:hypothetical protein